MAPYISEADFTDKAQILYRKVVAYYEHDADAKAVDIGLLKSAVARDAPKHAKLFEQLIDELEPVSTPNLLREVVSVKLRNVSVKLSAALLQGQTPEIDALMEEYRLYAAGELSEGSEQDAELFFKTDLVDYIAKNSRSGKHIRLYPKSLNDAIGGKGPLPGHHIIIFATPEVGKTMFAINLAAGMIRAGEKVLYISNEEPTWDVVLRFLSRMTKQDKEWVEANLNKAQAIAKPKGYDNLMVYGTARGTPKEITALVEKYKPDVVIADQMRNLQIPGTDGETSSIAGASRFMRSLGKKYGVLAVSITQASDDASGKLMLDQNDIYMSNISVPGDADLMIGIGSDDGYAKDNKRMIHLPKNKINGAHTFFQVRVQPAISRVESM